MKLPNGYGNVSKLPGNRRKPWRARKTAGWELGKQKFITVGYYETRAAALQALSEYNINPYSLDSGITFAEVYERWSDRKFAEISRSNINGYKAAYKLCDSISSMRFTDIKLPHLQAVVDASGKSYATLKKLKVLFNQLFDYAVQNEIIGRDRHIAEYVNIGRATKSDLHYRFTNDEINALWRWSDKNEYVGIILMLIYSGVRPGELFALKTSNVNLTDKWFYIEHGKNENAARKVPIHDRTYPLFKHWCDKGTEYLITQLNGREIRFDTNHGQYTESYWRPLLSDIGILTYTNGNGDLKEHTPDDTRHTFTTIWKEKQLDEAMRRKIQGHSGKGIGEQVYTHYELEALRAELNKL